MHATNPGPPDLNNQPDKPRDTISDIGKIDEDTGMLNTHPIVERERRKANMNRIVIAIARGRLL